MESYSYDVPLSLSTIRLTRILPQSSPEDIHISLQVADLNDELVYDALSYTWGRPCTIFSTAAERDAPPDPAVPIICDGKQLLVSKNLHDYLQTWLRMAELVWEGTDERVRLARETGMGAPEALWIDAICINQSDLIEKNQQVAMMGRIYSQSQRVITWLGPEDEFFRPALKLIFQLSSVSRSEASALRHLSDDQKCQALGVPSIGSSAWWPAFAFLNRSWFTRAWVIQEFALAPTLHVQCGMLSFGWPALSQACRTLRETRLDERLDGLSLLEMEGPKFLEPHFYEDMMPIIRTEERPDSDRYLFGSRKGHANNSSSFVVSLETIRLSCAIHLRPDFADVLKDPRYPNRGSGVPMFELLDEARETSCFDPKDKVYAFLEVAKQPYYQARAPTDARQDLVADYRLSIAEVYLQAAWYLLLSGDKLMLLSIAYSLKEEKDAIPGLPSWAPDWSYRRDHTAMPGLYAFMSEGWHATGNSNWGPPVEDKQYQPFLSVQGVLVDIICAVAEESTDVFAVSKAAIVAAGLPEEYPWVIPPQRSSEAFWRTLIADSTETEHPAPDFNVLFYNDIWFNEMSRAAREQFESIEKEKEWLRFVHTHSPLFGAVSDSLERSDTPEDQQDQKTTQTLPETVIAQPFDKVRDPITQSIIDHLESSTTANRSAPMSQLDVAMSLMTRGTGFEISEDGQLKARDDDTNAISEAEDQVEGMHSDTEYSGSPHEPGASVPRVPQADIRAPEFKRLMTRFTRKRLVFRTEKHYLGNGLKTLKVGDQVWLLSGAKVPMILRPLENGRYKFVTDAYVHGLMHGETWFGRDLELEDIGLE